MNNELSLPDNVKKYIDGMIRKSISDMLRSNQSMTPEQLLDSENRKKLNAELKASLTSVIYNKPIISQLWAETGSVTPPSSPQMSAGWGVSTVPASYFFNFIEQQTEQYLLHINQQGICIWDSSTDYPINGLAKGSDGGIYSGRSTPNVANDPTTDIGTNWVPILSGEGLLTLPLAILEYKPTTSQNIPFSSGEIQIILDNNVKTDPRIITSSGTFQPLVPGWWEFTVTICAGISADTNCGLELHKDGVRFKFIDAQESPAIGSKAVGFNGSEVVYADGTNVFSLWANSGGTSGGGTTFGNSNTDANTYSNFTCKFISK